MRSKKRTTGATAGSLSQSIQNLPQQSTLVALKGKASLISSNQSRGTLSNVFSLNLWAAFEFLLFFVSREIESARALDATLPPKFWTKQQFAVGVNEVTRALEWMPLNHGNNIPSEEHSLMNLDDAKGPGVHLQAILLASDCNPRSMTKHLPALAASRNIPIISIKDRKEGCVRLGELMKLKTAITIGIKAKGNAVNQLIEEALKEELC